MTEKRKWHADSFTHEPLMFLVLATSRANGGFDVVCVVECSSLRLLLHKHVRICGDSSGAAVLVASGVFNFLPSFCIEPRH